MRRREFITLLGGAATWPLAAHAQQAGKVYRVGLIFAAGTVSMLNGPEPVHAPARAFVQGLRALGYVEGQNLILERRAAEGRIERLGDIVADLVRLQVDVIVTVSTPTAQAAKAVTSTVPIVMATSADPVGDGIVQSLARPGGNITGLSLAIGPEIEAKRLELLGEMLPGVSRVAFLSSKEDWESPSGKSVRTAAQALGMMLVLAEHTPNQYTDAFTLISRTRSEALFVSWGPTSFVNRGLIVEFATRERLPSTFFFREPVELGGAEVLWREPG